jgi:hypothetical protein
MIKIKPSRPQVLESIELAEYTANRGLASNAKSALEDTIITIASDRPSILTDKIIKECSAKDLSLYLNDNLAKVGIKTSTTLKDCVVTVDQETMRKIVQVANEGISNNFFGPQEAENLIKLIETAEKKNIPIILRLTGTPLKYWNTKQYGFHGVTFLHALRLRTEASALAAVAGNGAAALTIGSGVAISFTGVMFLSLLESYVPVGPVKEIVKGSKLVVGIPIVFVEYTANIITGVFEKALFNQTFPTNITSTFGILDGPELSKLNGFKGLKKVLATALTEFAKKLAK